MSERPVRQRPRRLADWINPTGAKKVHSLVDKVYRRKNVEVAWERVKANRGSGGVDGQSLQEFEQQLDLQLDRLCAELREDRNTKNPGTTADLTAAAICAIILMHGWPSTRERSGAEQVSRRGQ